MEGWIKLHRNITEHWLWKDEPYDKARAWIDLIMLANYEDKKTAYKGEIITCKRGDVNLSISFLANRWKWDRRTVKHFLSLLEKDGMCILNCTTHRTTITIVNYGFYQDVGTTECTTECTTKSQQDVQQSPTTKKDKKDKKVKNININNSLNSILVKPLFEMPLNDGSSHPIYEEDLTKYKSLYPNVDVEQQIRNMIGWLESNPTRRKTKSGIKRFINSWLAKEQDKGKGNMNGYGAGSNNKRVRDDGNVEREYESKVFENSGDLMRQLLYGEISFDEWASHGSGLPQV